MWAQVQINGFNDTEQMLGELLNAEVVELVICAVDLEKNQW